MTDEFFAGAQAAPITPGLNGASRTIHNSLGATVYYCDHPEFSPEDPGVIALAKGETKTVTHRVWLRTAGKPEAAILVEP